MSSETRHRVHRYQFHPFLQTAHTHTLHWLSPEFNRPTSIRFSCPARHSHVRLFIFCPRFFFFFPLDNSAHCGHVRKTIIGSTLSPGRPLLIAFSQCKEAPDCTPTIERLGTVEWRCVRKCMCRAECAFRGVGCVSRRWGREFEKRAVSAAGRGGGCVRVFFFRIRVCVVLVMKVKILHTRSEE